MASKHKFANATPAQKASIKDLKLAGWEYYKMSDMGSVLLRKGSFCDRREACVYFDGSVIQYKAGAGIEVRD